MELWDVYDINRQPLGHTHQRGIPLPKGEYHQVVHVCLFNHAGEMLIQQRQPFKEGWPNLWVLRQPAAFLPVKPFSREQLVNCWKKSASKPILPVNCRA